MILVLFMFLRFKKPAFYLKFYFPYFKIFNTVFSEIFCQKLIKLPIDIILYIF